MVTSIMKKGIIRERKKNRRQTIAVWITTCIATALFAAVFSFASSCQAGLIEAEIMTMYFTMCRVRRRITL